MLQRDRARARETRIHRPRNFPARASTGPRAGARNSIVLSHASCTLSLQRDRARARETGTLCCNVASQSGFNGTARGREKHLDGNFLRVDPVGFNGTARGREKHSRAIRRGDRPSLQRDRARARETTERKELYKIFPRSFFNGTANEYEMAQDVHTICIWSGITEPGHRARSLPIPDEVLHSPGIYDRPGVPPLPYTITTGRMRRGRSDMIPRRRWVLPRFRRTLSLL